MQLRSEIHVRRRRKPERGALHQVLLAHVETFLERARAPDSGHGLPRFVERELRRYLECGLLAHGFARVHCSRCLHDELVAFSYQGRGFCPSWLEAMLDGKLPEGRFGAVLTSALFAALGTLNRHPMIVGLGYAFAIEGFLANMPGKSQTWTAQYYLRSTLLSRNPELWKLIEEVQLTKFDIAAQVLTTLAIVLVVSLALGSVVISRRQ